MSALPNRLPAKPAPAKSKPAVPDRAVLEKLRTSDYDKQTGYAPLWFSMMADLPRLTSGNACTILILQVILKSWGRHPGDKKKRDEWTLPVPVQEWATLSNCDVRTIEREIAGLEKRGMAETKRDGRRGMIAIRLLVRAWPKLPDYKSNVVDISTGQEPEEDTGEDEAKKAGYAELTKKAVAARAGKSSRSIPVNCGVRAFRFQNDSPVVDLSFTAVVQAGELVVRSQVPDEWLKNAVKKIARSNQTNDLTDLSRHGCRDTFASPSPTPKSGVNKPSTGESKAKQGTQGESAADYCKIHPRATEICNLFDPILLKSQSRLLSADSVALTSACQAVGETDKDYLLKFVMQRADRPVNSPKHVAHIVAEAAKNWEKVKDMPASQQNPKPANRASLVERTLAESKRRLAKYGRL